MRCLVADDNPEMRRILAETLESFSFRVSMAEDGAAALEELTKAAGVDPFKLVLLDWKMPGLDGNEVARRIKNDPDLNVPQILMITAYGREEIMRMAEDSGVSAFLVKPVNASTLFDTVMEVFGKKVAKKVHGVKKSAIDKGAVASIRGAKILLVEDNEINQQVATEILSQAGLVVSIAGNGIEAVKAVAANDYDVVLMDIHMPEMDGLEATSRIRALDKPEARELPIIAMTAHALAGDREKSLEAGMNDHVTKPINPQELFGALLRWIKPGERQAPTAMEPAEDEAALEDNLPLAGLPGLSIKLGLSRVGGNRKLYKQLLSKFAAGNSRTTATIREDLDRGDDKTAARLAHTIKSVAGNIGAENLSRAAGELERAVKAGETPAVNDLLVDFGRLMEQVLDSIRELEKKWRQTLKPETRPDLDLQAARAVLIDLRNLLETDMAQAMTRAEELKGLTAAAELAPNYKLLRKSLDGFDTEEAATAIEALITQLDDLKITPADPAMQA
jgi:CheY-like chemotaxis protein